MSDLINRQAAIDAINTWDKFGVDERSRVVRWHKGLEPYVHLRDVVAAIGNLPSAQPDVPDTNVGDMISKQATITEFKNYERDSTAPIDYVKIVEQMPSAQPERDKGEWIVFKAPDALHCGLVKCPFCSEELTAEPDEYHFCPNCGADMRKPNAD